MKREIPILFSTEMVQAILAGKKTMTRRIVKPQPIIDQDSGSAFDGNHKRQYDIHNWKERFIDDFSRWMPGDILWVRETCCAHELANGDDGVLYKAGAHFLPIENSQEAANRWIDLKHYGKTTYRDVPSIHMPKWASRIWLEVTDIKVERLQDISERDVLSEGCGRGVRQMSLYGANKMERQKIYARSFGWLWKEINGAESWDANPWVWVVSFMVLSTTGRSEMQLETQNQTYAK